MNKETVRAGSTFHFEVDRVTPGFVHAHLVASAAGGPRVSSCGILRMPADLWVSFITTLQAGAQVMGERVEVLEKNGISRYIRGQDPSRNGVSGA